MSIQSITTNKAPLPIGSYSQAIEAGNFVFISGQIGLVPESGEMRVTFLEQVAQVFENLFSVAQAAGCSFSNVTKYNIYLTDLSLFSEVNDYMQAHLPQPFPARATVQVSALPKGAQVEIDAILYKSTSVT